MISANNLRFMEDDPAGPPPNDPFAELEPPSAAVEPNVFVRTIATPPALPWAQARVADLDARHGSPIPVSQVIYQLRRLEGWRPGTAGRFAAFYVLASEVDGRLDASAEVDGKTVSVTFVTGSARVAKAGQAVLRGAAIVGVAMLLAWSLGVALTRRAETAATVQLVEQRASSKLKRVETARRGQDLDRLLSLQLQRGTSMRVVLDDLTWLSNAKAPDARIESIHWEPGLMAVGAKGEASPVQPAADRAVRRAARPLRPGVWLWGVSEPLPPGGGPIAAKVGP